MFVEWHMIQSFVPSNLNRDDSNNPKECEFGGVRRARISSQCLKRAIRRAPEFAEATGVPCSARTRLLVQHLTERLVKAGKTSEETAAVLERFIRGYLTKLKAEKTEFPRTDVMLYFSQAELDAMYAGLLAEWEGLAMDDKKALSRLTKSLSERFKQHTSGPDIALFGRMLAGHPDLNLEASCQVAHAISTHRVALEMDWWTAVDDLQPKEQPGAGMMDYATYNSACFYRYARIDWTSLCKHLGDALLAQRTVRGFLRAAISAVPSGKQSGTAAYNPPSFLLGVVRRDGMAWSLGNAFECPVRADRQGGLVRPSVAALDTYWGGLCRIYGDSDLAAVAAVSLEDDMPLAHLARYTCESSEKAIEAIVAALPVEQEAV